MIAMLTQQDLPYWIGALMCFAVGLVAGVAINGWGVPDADDLDLRDDDRDDDDA